MTNRERDELTARANRDLSMPLARSRSCECDARRSVNYAQRRAYRKTRRVASSLRDESILKTMNREETAPSMNGDQIPRI